MKVVLGILVLLHCAAQVQTLSCLTCAAGTADEATCTTQVCAGGESWCFNTHTVTGSTITVEKGCALTCVPDPTTICCNTIDCNGVCCIGPGCNEILICFKCDETTDESSCTPSPCAAATFCQSDYKLNGAGVPVVIKSCAADCKAVDNTADKNVRTTCCKTGYCNGNALSCNTCSNEADEPECAATACAATDKLCQSTYTLTAPDVPVSKACAEACTPSATVKCCGTSQCNVDLLKCYTCTDLTDESNCKDITVCGYGDKFCKTTYKLTGTGK
ncbi:keratin-associated protein 9-3-like isoform X4 [Acipenser ruthenus]|uniref:keratin-associated protein 9-3-like isoform X4 n=1 Tax=Acipenser ruthenus TaxID=7906 RepID=UPI0027413439|nr:keratin-associated protein 9-3-like isoform X4 [Acipenser ruthenus]